jgi:hypothetical protein
VVSKRLQVLMSDEEYACVRSAAISQKVPLGEFVRRELRSSCANSGARSADEVFRVLDWAMKCNFPTADIEQMNEEIERGYRTGLP